LTAYWVCGRDTTPLQ